MALLEVKDLHVHFMTYDGVAWVINGVDLSLERGEILGIVGEAGTGKSVLIRAILKLVRPPGRVVKGEVIFEGANLLRKSEEEMRSIRGRDISLMVPGARSHLNPLAKVGNLIADVVVAHKAVSRAQALEQAQSLLSAVGIPDPERRMRCYPHELSGGMCQRVVVATALANSPKLLLADEPTSDLDVTIQLQVLDLLQDLIRDFGSACILVTRDLSIVAHYCDRVAVIYAGQIAETAPVRDFFAQATHPYSVALLRAALAARGVSQDITISGLAPNPIELPEGCFLHPRCPIADENLCPTSRPALELYRPDHYVRCHYKEEIH